MELHESLHELGSRLGHGLFTDAENFRGALNDYVDESSASVGDINLLVDAVRLGAFRSMTTMLESGASSDSAIAEAGTRLARDRGSSDANGAMWACAVLGYAIDQVSEPQIRRYADQRSGVSSRQAPPSGPATQPPPYQSPQQPPPYQSPQRPPAQSPQPPPYQSPQRPPAQSPQPPPYQSPQPAPPARNQPPPSQRPAAAAPQQPAAGGSSGGAPVQPTIWPRSGGAPGQSSADRTSFPGQGSSSADGATNPRLPVNPDPTAARPGASSGSAPTQFHSGDTPGGPRTPTSQGSPPGSQSSPQGSQGSPPAYSTSPTASKKKPLLLIVAAVAAVLVVIGVGIPVALSLGGGGGEDDTQTLATADVNADYEALGEDVTAGADDCTEGDRSLGQKEVVTCVVKGGTLTLITYNDVEALQSSRAKTIHLGQGTLTGEDNDGTYFAFDPAAVEGTEQKATVYWDSEKAAQAATYTATKDDEGAAEDLGKLQDSTKPTVDAPSEIDSSDLEEFADDFQLENCDRTFTQYKGAAEESACTLGGNDISVGQFTSLKYLNIVRKWARLEAKKDGCPNFYQSDKKPNCENSRYFTDVDGQSGYDPSGGDIERGRLWGFVDQDDDDKAVVYVERVDCLCFLIARDSAGDPNALSDLLSKQLQS